MPRFEDISSILIIGSGPIIIGQACEFDYSGTQACKVLKQDGFRVILVNNNPATIMTDPEFSDRTYIEPITIPAVARIIEKEKPDALLPTMGGQMGLNIAYQLARKGLLKKYKVRLIGANLTSIKKAEDRDLFKKAMMKIGLNVPGGGIARNINEALHLIDKLNFPVIIRPAFTLGGTGGNIAFNMDDFKEFTSRGIGLSPIRQVMIEESFIGWKEYELELMRDRKDNTVVVCSIENVDPMGIHTGDSITVAPAQTLTDREYQLMRDASIKIMREIGVDTGGSNIQFAICPQTGKMVVIEMNPRVSRSSALASKATGFPIAKISAKLAVGYGLDEITNDITRKTPACFEPTIDYVVVKIPRWDFSKFPEIDTRLGIQMKSVGEAMAFGRTFREALLKAIRSLEIDREGLRSRKIVREGVIREGLRSVEMDGERMRSPESASLLNTENFEKLFLIRHAIIEGFSIEKVRELTGIDPWFINNIKQIVECEQQLEKFKLTRSTIPKELLKKAKSYGFSDRDIAEITGLTEKEVRELRKRKGINVTFKTVDTCAAEFESFTPYCYSTYETENEVQPSGRKKIMILGSGPNRIGQGIEFDYVSVHGVFALKEEGYETIMVNSNPETVSTDYDTADRLYFEPITLENVLNIAELERPEGIIVQFGGQTPLKIAKQLEKEGFKILGTSTESIDIAEDRKKFGELLDEMNITHPPYGTAFSDEDAVKISRRIGFPLLIRPSYVLGGRSMEIVYDENSLKNYVTHAVRVSPEYPVLIDKFLEDAFEFDVDAVSDGEDVYIGGVMQHIEEAGIHSGDSACVIPPYFIYPQHLKDIKDITHTLSKRLKIKGLINIQFAIQDNTVYVLEVNPRASRTVPFVSKATGLPLAKLAAKIMAGRRIKDLKLKPPKVISYVAVKAPVFPFNKLPGSSVFPGPEMRSTGEVMGISPMFGESFAKAYEGTGVNLPTKGTIFISVNDFDKRSIIPIARDFSELGFKIIATDGTSKALNENGIFARRILKVREGRPNILDYLERRKVQLIINTPFGKAARRDEYRMGSAAIKHSIPFITTLSGAAAAVRGIRSLQGGRGFSVQCLQEYYK